MRILAVDDEPLVIRLLDATLKGLDYQDVEFATSGVQALHMLRTTSKPYSCILLDIRMPGMDGIELCQRIRRLPGYRHTPIIMLTALAEKVYIDQSFASGATDYINKPIDATELGARLRVAKMLHLEQHRAEVSAIAERTLREELDTVRAFDLSEPVPIENVPRVINALALENYLHQLNNVGLFKVGLIGFQISHVANLYATNRPGPFLDILTDVAEAIFENTRTVESMISYFGDGGYVAVVPRASMFDTEELSNAISMTLQEYQLADSTHIPTDISVSVGEQVNGSLFGNNPRRMIERALRNARVSAESQDEDGGFWMRRKVG